MCFVIFSNFFRNFLFLLYFSPVFDIINLRRIENLPLRLWKNCIKQIPPAAAAESEQSSPCRPALSRGMRQNSVSFLYPSTTFSTGGYAMNQTVHRKGSAVLSVFLGLLLALSILLLILFLFLSALGESGASLTEIGLAGFWTSWVPPVLSGLLILLFLVLLLLWHRHRSRRFFLNLGISSVTVGFLSAGMGIVLPWIRQQLPAGWQNALVNSWEIFQGYSLFWAMLLLALGAGCLSGYFCVRAGKGGRNEKGV